MTNYKIKRSEDNKAPKSGAIRKGSMKPDEITKVAEELTKGQLTATGQAIKTYKAIVENKAPKIEPVATPGNYKVYAEALKAMISEHETVEVTGDQLHKIFPQARCGGEAALQLKRSHGLSYIRVENGRNDTYVFFVEPTREELIVMLTSAETRVIELQGKLQTMKNANNQTYEALSKLEQSHIRKKEENTKLKSDLSNSKRSNNILFRFAIGAVITIFIKSVAL